MYRPVNVLFQKLVFFAKNDDTYLENHDQLKQSVKKHLKAVDEIKECCSFRLEVRSIVLTPEIGKVKILVLYEIGFSKITFACW